MKVWIEQYSGMKETKKNICNWTSERNKNTKSFLSFSTCEIYEDPTTKTFSHQKNITAMYHIQDHELVMMNHHGWVH
jgi:hypothetical protein